MTDSVFVFVVIGLWALAAGFVSDIANIRLLKPKAMQRRHTPSF